MALFELPTRPDRAKDNSIIKKANTKAKSTTTLKGGSGVSGQIATITAMVEKNLGHFKEQSLLIRDKETLVDYINQSIENGAIAIDTETTGLDPLQDTLVGICIYTPNRLTAYIPLNHISYITNLRVDNQLPIDIVREQFQRIADTNTKVIMFNAPFDIRFLRSGIGVSLECYWDCYVGARLLNENEGAGNNGLKKLHQKYVLNGVGDAFKFDDLFRGITFDKVPITTGYLYAAHDAIITFELYEYQKKYLYYEPECDLSDRNGMNGVSWVFFNIEMPIVDVVATMEDNGITFDLDYAHKLSIEYNEKLQDKLDEFYDLLDEPHTKHLIDDYMLHNPNAKLDTPINIASSTQIAILLYDILGVEEVDKKNPRGTGVEILSKIDNPICKAILGYREVSKLLSTYIDKLPNCVNPNDGRVHCKFNQYGADTGRFSSNDPNLQNIPSHNHEIRQMFTAKKGYVLMSSDFDSYEMMNTFIVDRWCEVEIPNGWKYADNVVIGDELKTQDEFGNDTTIFVKKIVIDKNQIKYYY